MDITASFISPWRCPLLPATPSHTAPFSISFFPQQVALVSVGENMFPMGYWTVVSKQPFRILLLVQLGNHSLTLLREYQEAAFHFMPWEQRDLVAWAGHISGRDVNKAEKLGFTLKPAQKLQHTKLIEGAEAIYELLTYKVLEGISTEFEPHVMDVVAAHINTHPTKRKPIFYLSNKDFATLGERWRYPR